MIFLSLLIFPLIFLPLVSRTFFPDISPSCRESKAHVNLALSFPGGVSVLGDPVA